MKIVKTIDESITRHTYTIIDVNNSNDFQLDCFLESDIMSVSEINEIFDVIKIEQTLGEDDYCIEFEFKKYFESRDYIKCYIYRSFIERFHRYQEETQDYTLRLLTENESFSLLICYNSEYDESELN